MKKFLAVVMLVMFATNVLAAEFKLVIPDAKLSRVTNAMKGLFGPIPDADEDGTPDYTDNQWAKEVLRLWVVNQVRRWESAEAVRIAREGVLPDNDIAN